jgi:hypothetical protein
MAAVLCTLPCRLCNAGCKLCSEACDCCSNACRCVCKPLCEVLKSLCDALKSPFCFFVTVTMALNVPSIAMAAMVLMDYGVYVGSDCQGILWNLVNLPFCVINVVAAWYMAYTVGKERRNDSSEPSASTTVNYNRSTARGRLTHLMCYDNWIALYILVAVGFFAWQGVGSVWIAKSATQQQYYCPSSVMQRWGTALGCSWAYIAVGGIALCISACCASCCEHREGTSTSAPPQQFYMTPAQRQELMMEEGKKTATQPQEDIPIVQAIIVEDPNLHNKAPVPDPSAPPLHHQEAPASANATAPQRVSTTISNMLQRIKQGNTGNAKIW